jgi:sugar phosphate isomerase/epimerase
MPLPPYSSPTVSPIPLAGRLSRRTIVFSALAPFAVTAFAESQAKESQNRKKGKTMSGKMTLAMHQNTSAAAGFRKILEGWAKAGIKEVEIPTSQLDPFLKTESIDTARRLLSDLGLKPISCTPGLPDLFNDGPGHAEAIDQWKRRCEQFATLGKPLGLTKIYNPTGTQKKITEDDYKSGLACIREAGEIAKDHGLVANMEFARNSPYISTLTTALKMTRAAGHSNVKVLFDCYHFWSGLNKFEDMDLIQPGEIGHAHFNDTPDMPRELLGQTTRVIPGDGVAPLVRIIRKLAEKGYSGPLSVELFLPKFQEADPETLAREILQKAGKVMKDAGVV